MTRKEAKQIQSLKTAMSRMQVKASAGAGGSRKPKKTAKKKKHLIRDGGYLAFTHTRDAPLPRTFSSHDSFLGAPYLIKGQQNISVGPGEKLAILVSSAWLMTGDHNLMFDEGAGAIPPVTAKFYTFKYYKYTDSTLPLDGNLATATSQWVRFPGQTDISTVGTAFSEPSIKSTFDGLKIGLNQNVTQYNMGFKVTTARLHNGGSFTAWDDVNNIITVPSPDAITGLGLPHAVTQSVPRGSITQHFLPLACNDPVYSNRNLQWVNSASPTNSASLYGYEMKPAAGAGVVGGTSFSGVPAAHDLCMIVEPYDTSIENNFTLNVLARYFSRQFRITAPGYAMDSVPHKPSTGIAPADPARAAKQSMVKAKTAQKHAEGDPTGVDKAEDLAEGGAAMVGGGSIVKGLVGTAEKGLSSVVTGIEEVGADAVGLLEGAAPLLIGL